MKSTAAYGGLRRRLGALHYNGYKPHLANRSTQYAYEMFFSQVAMSKNMPYSKNRRSGKNVSNLQYNALDV